MLTASASQSNAGSISSLFDADSISSVSWSIASIFIVRSVLQPTYRILNPSRLLQSFTTCPKLWFLFCRDTIYGLESSFIAIVSSYSNKFARLITLTVQRGVCFHVVRQLREITLLLFWQNTRTKLITVSPRLYRSRTHGVGYVCVHDIAMSSAQMT